MKKTMLIDAVHPEEMRMIITDHKSTIHEFDFTTAAKQQIKGNIYLAKVTRVEPSLQAAFVEYGGGKQGFLPFAEIHPDYYQIPIADRKRLLEEEEAFANEEELQQEDDRGRRRGRRGRRRRGRDRDEAQTDAASTTETEETTEETHAESDASEEKEAVDTAPESSEDTQEPEAATDAEDTENTAEDKTRTQKPASPPKKPKSRSKTIDENIGLETDARVSIDADAEALEADDAEAAAEEEEEVQEAAAADTVTSGDTVEGSDAQEVETLSSDDEIERPRRMHFSRRYKIQEVIKRNQIMLVQVIKEERGNKGVSLTSYISLAGRYCVLMPNSPRGGGVSRKIGTGDDRKRLKSIISDLDLPRGMSVIIRTAGSNRTRAEIKRDFDYLVKLWNQIREDTLASSAPALIYEESNLIKRSIRDAYNNEIDEIMVEGDAAYKEAKAFMRMLVPSHAPRVKQYKETTPLFYRYGVEEQLLSMYDPVVKLKSGGYLVINPTEALISIDVNSGRSTGERNIEETAVKTNSEAAAEVARQLRLRDLAGLIVIDFIDMMDGKNRRKIEHALKDALRSDRAKIQIGRISPFGLMEMSRQRLRPSISEAMNRPCDHCRGTGHVRSDAAVAIQLIRNLERDVGSGGIEKFRVWLTPSVAVYLLNEMRDKLDKLENDGNLTIEVQIDSDLREGNFRVEKIRNKDKSREKDQQTRDNNSAAKQPSEPESETETTEEERGEGRHSRRRRRRDRRRGRDREQERDSDTRRDSTKSDNDDNVEKQHGNRGSSSDESTENPTENRGRRERGGHRKRWNKDGDEESAPPARAELPEGAPSPSLVVMQPSAANQDEPSGIEAASKPRSPARKGWWQRITE